MFQRLLVALDGSATSQLLFDRAVALAKPLGARLMVLHVVSGKEENVPSLPGYVNLVSYPAVDVELLSQYQNEWERYVQESLEQLYQWCEQGKAAGVTVEVTQGLGNPAAKICELATLWQADGILVGSRGRTGLSEFLLGSVSNDVVHHAPCAVLVIPLSAEAPVPLPPFDSGVFLQRVQQVCKNESPELTVTLVEPDLCRVNIPDAAAKMWIQAAYGGPDFQVFVEHDPHKEHPPAFMGEIWPNDEAVLRKKVADYVLTSS